MLKWYSLVERYNISEAPPKECYPYNKLSSVTSHNTVIFSMQKNYKKQLLMVINYAVNNL
jgi:hypothetical protein